MPIPPLPELNTQHAADFFNVKSPEMLINMRPGDIPPPTHSDYIQFVQHERLKCQEGVNINGQFIVPNLYYHLNLHTIPLDKLDHTGKVIREIGRPTLRDNEWIIHNDYYQAWKNREVYLIAGSRQISKTVSLVSLTCRELFCYDNAEVMGLFSISADKDTFNKYMQVALADKSNFLVIPSIDKDLSQTEIRFGLTRKNNEPIVLSRLYTYLTKAGKATEIGAGKTLTLFFLDELAKEPVREVWEAVKPALVSQFGYRCAPFFSFTGGNVEKSKDALNMFHNPAANNIMPFETEGKKTGKFMGGWYRQDFKKNQSLASYLNQPETGELAMIQIAVTDFDQANAVLDKEQEEARADKDPLAVVKHKMYYPRSLDEMALSAIESPFKRYRDGLKKHQDFLYATKPGAAYHIYKKLDGTVDAVLVDKRAVANFPHNDTDDLDAPLIIYDKPSHKYSIDLHIGGLDIYHLAKSETSPSLGALYIFRRNYGSLTDAYQDTMVASIAARPERTQDFLATVKLVLDYYQAKMLHESTNDMVLAHFDVNHQADQYLAKSWSLIQEVSPNSKSRSTYGVPATPAFQRAWMGRILDYISEVVGTDAGGNPIYGYTRILDPLLIEEMLQYTDSLNVDRLVSWGHVLLYNHNLAKDFQPQVEPEEEVVPEPYRRQIYGMGKPTATTTSPYKKNPFFR